MAMSSGDHACCLIRMHIEPYPFIEIVGGGAAPGTMLQLGVDVVKDGLHQLWKFVESGIPDVYFIQTAMETEYVLTAAAGGETEGRPTVQPKKPGADPSQLWLLCAPHDYRVGRCIMSYVVGGRSSLVLDARGARTGPGTDLILFARHNGNNQRWYVEVKQTD